MCEHTFAVDVAYGVDALSCGGEVVVGDDEAAGVDVDSGIGASVGCDGFSADSHKHDGCADFGAASFGVVVLQVEYASVGVAAYRGDARSDDEFDASAREHAAESFGYVGFEGGEYLRAVFEDGDVDAEGVEDVSHFHCDDASADDGDAWGQCVCVQQVVAGDGEVCSGDVERGGCASGGDDYAVGAVLVVADLYGALRGDDGCAVYDVTLLNDGGDIRAQCFDDAVGVGASGLPAVVVGAWCVFGGSGGEQSCGGVAEAFGGDASSVEAYPAEVSAFDDGDADAFGGLLGGDFVAAGSGADDYQVAMLDVAHSASVLGLLSSCQVSTGLSAASVSSG